MASFGTLLSEAFGTVETLDNQNKESDIMKTLTKDNNHMKNICSSLCQASYHATQGNPPSSLTDSLCSPGCLKVSQKMLKEMGPGPSGPSNNSDAHASETPIKESFSSLEGMQHRQPRPGPPRHGPGRHHGHHGHHGNRNPSYVLVGDSRGFFKNVKNNLDLLLILSVLIILLVVGLVVMRK